MVDEEDPELQALLRAKEKTLRPIKYELIPKVLEVVLEKFVTLLNIIFLRIGSI